VLQRLVNRPFKPFILGKQANACESTFCAENSHVRDTLVIQGQLQKQGLR
jgi:hypothetical protein